MAEELDSQEITEDEDGATEVETPTGEDEAEDEESTEEEPAEEETGAEEESEDESEPTFDKRFTQFKGDDLEAYTKNLETGYANSSAEATRLTKQLAEYKQKIDGITAAVANDPAIAEKLSVATASPDPALTYARQQMETAMKQEYDTFAKDHPEIESDPDTADRLTKRLTILAKSVLEEEGRILGMGEGLAMAWSSLGLGNNSQEMTRMAAKNVAATTKPASSKKSIPKSDFTPSQLDVAKRLGLSEKDLAEQLTK